MAKKELTHEQKKGYKFPSVTTVLENVRKYGLEIYFKNNTPEYIKKRSEETKQIGTDFHSTVYNFIEKTGLEVVTQYPKEVSNCINSFQLFRKENPQIVLVKSELKIESEKWQYSGALDMEALEDGCLILIDWKTRDAKEEKKPAIYDEDKYQVSAYWEAYEEQEKKKLYQAYIVALARDKVAYNMKPITREAKEIKWFPLFKCYRDIHYTKKIRIPK